MRFYAISCENYKIVEFRRFRSRSESVVSAVYANLYHAFGVWFIVLFYVIAMVLLGFHLYHGAWSLFQSLGIDNPDRNRGLRLAAAAAAVILVVGFSAVPLLFVAGVMPSPPAAETVP